jgi:[ribosomal protein S5]-alanine N-acetyltransferase
MLPTIPLSKTGWTLRAWRETDAPALSEHAGNVNVWRNMSDSFPHPYTLEIANVWVTRGHVDFGGDNWAIAFNDAAVGGCGVAQQKAQFRCNAEIGYWLAQSFWGQGVGTLVAQALAKRAFTNPDITRVFAPIHAHNTGSMRVAEKAGLVREGLQPQSAIKDGRVIDRVVWAAYRHPVGSTV